MVVLYRCCSLIAGYCWLSPPLPATYGCPFTQPCLATHHAHVTVRFPAFPTAFVCGWLLLRSPLFAPARVYLLLRRLLFTTLSFRLPHCYLWLFPQFPLCVHHARSTFVLRLFIYPALRFVTLQLRVPMLHGSVRCRARLLPGLRCALRARTFLRALLHTPHTPTLRCPCDIYLRLIVGLPRTLFAVVIFIICYCVPALLHICTFAFVLDGTFL